MSSLRSVARPTKSNSKIATAAEPVVLLAAFVRIRLEIGNSLTAKQIMQNKKVKLLIFAWLFSLASALSAQKVLEKPFQKWSKDEATNLLTDSP